MKAPRSGHKRTPAGQHVAAWVSSYIQEKDLKSGDRMPSMLAAAEITGRSFGSVWTGYQLAQDGGLIKCHRQRGTFVQ